MRISCVIFSTVVSGAIALAQHALSPAEFLRQLMQDPSRIPAYEEGLRVMDQIGSMSPESVRGTLPVVFEALHSERQMAQIEGALALHSIAIRPDGMIHLTSRLDEILALLGQPDSRLKATAVIVAEKISAPTAKVTPVFVKFIADQGQPAQVKPGVVGALIRMTPLSPETAGVIGNFLRNTLDASVRIDTLNAIGSRPSDNSAQADLVIQSLRDPSDSVRNAAIHILKRLGPKAVARGSSLLFEVANDPNESQTVRVAAERAIKN